MLVFAGRLFSFFKTMKAQDPNEIFDVVDADDRVIGLATRTEVHAKKLFHRAVHILVFTPRGSVVLQRRSLDKDTCPGLLSTACAGHVDAGENYDTAAIRELWEELGIASDYAAKHLECVGIQAPSKANGNEFVRVYVLPRFTGTLRANPAEIESLEIFSRERLNEAIAAHPEYFASSFIGVWTSFFCRKR